MLSIKPSGGQFREDYPILAITASVSNPGGTYYMGPSGLVNNASEAFRIESAGPRLIRGIRAHLGSNLATGTVITVTPVISINDGDTYTDLASLVLSLSGSSPTLKRRNKLTISQSSELVDIPDGALIAVKVLLSRVVNGQSLAVSLLAY